ncbi:MAG: ATP-binding protein [Gammaproteobacteria bacterium]
MFNHFLISGYHFQDHENDLLFKYRVLNSFMGIAIIFGFMIGTLGVIGIMQIGIIQSSIYYAYAFFNIFLIWYLRRSRQNYITAARLQVTVSLITFIGALVFVSNDEFRIVWFYIAVYISYILLGVRSGVIVTGISILSIILSHIFLDLNITETAIYTAVFGLLVTSLLTHAYTTQMSIYESKLKEKNRSLEKNIYELDDALSQANQASTIKSLFLANMSHEIRTPMNGVLSMVQVLQNTNLTEQQKYYLKSLDRSGKSLLALLDELLDLSKIESGTLELNIKSFRLWQWVEDILLFVEPMFEEGPVALTVDVDNDMPYSLMGDETRLRQVVLNLVSNAAKYTEMGEVRLKVYGQNIEADDFRLVIEVEDTGVGISQKKLETIFEPYQQISPERTANKGVGLGLSICKRIIDKMDGELMVLSEPGIGSKFILNVALPLGDLSQHYERRIQGSVIEKPLSILVADDDRISRMAVKALLAAQRHNIKAVENGKQAIEALQISDYDLLIMDIHMPIMDGITATKLIKQQSLTAAPIIAMTASVMSDEREIYFAAGIDALIEKPFNFNLLCEMIKQTLH